MAKNTTNSNNILKDVVENQSKMVEGLVNTTKDLTKNFPLVAETLDKGHNFYKQTVEKGTQSAQELNNQFQNTFNNMKTNQESTANYFNQWFQNQMEQAKNMFSQTETTKGFENWTKQATDAYQNFGKNFNMDGINNMWSQNPMASMMQNEMLKNMMNQNPMANMMNMNAMSDMMRNMMTLNIPHKMNEYMNNFQGQTKNYLSMMNNGFGDWTKQFEDMTSANSFKDMQTMVNSLTKFSDLWAPMFNSMKDGKFDMTQFNSLMNPAKYKEFMDNFFNFMPDSSKQAMEQMQTTFVNTMKEMATMGNTNYGFMKHAMSTNPLAGMGSQTSMWDMYTMMRNAMNEASSPLTKLMEGNPTIESINKWNEIYDRMVEFNTKNNELQYMMYQHGAKVMQEVAESVMAKMQNGESVDSIVKVYQEWMMKGDQVFTTLFETDAYSALMTEVSSLQMKLKMDMEQQMEKMLFANMPIATRTEMDEVYKSLYDVKKMARNLEKMFGMDSGVVDAKTNNTTSKKAPSATTKTATKAAPAKKVVAKKVAVKTVVTKKATPKKVAKKK